MNCSIARANLPLLLYGDLPPAEKASVETHLTECRSCQSEYRALQHVRRTLGLVAAPEVHVDLPQLYRRATERQERRLRRWRRIALGAASAAALIGLLIAIPHLEARVESHQLIVRWGSLPDAPPASGKMVALPEAAKSAAVPQATEEQLRLLSELIHALADSVQSVDSRERQDTAQLLARLVAMQQHSAQRWAALERTVDTLYLSLQKGE
jgi:anti-sigma factor RsiW